MSNQGPVDGRLDTDLRYLLLLSRQFPTVQAVSTELIKLRAKLGLPKSSERFMSDVHGEYEAFEHILNNCSGAVREHVDLTFGDDLSDFEKDELCTLIYYPSERLAQLRRRHLNFPAWYRKVLMELVTLARQLSSMYTSAHVRAELPEGYSDIIEELLRVYGIDTIHHSEYHDDLINAIVDTGAADGFVCALSRLIKRLAVEDLHLVGDIYDRGPHGDLIMDRLIAHRKVDVQWGNHDIVWMGAACGSEACIVSVVRTQIRYNTLEIIEGAYGISLRRLALFAERTYRKDDVMSPLEKAITVILFKVEGQLIQRHPNYGMDDRLLLGALDLNRGTVRIEGRDYGLLTVDFPTVDPQNPYDLSDEERDLVDELVESFHNSERLHRHVAFLYEQGSIYLINNGNLLFHGCVPLEMDGSFTPITGDGVIRHGKSYLDWCDRVARRAWHKGDQRSLDLMWYLWCGRRSPLSGRVTKTFERAFVADRSAWDEPEDPYFSLTEDAAVCERILAEFGLTGPHAHIINGHKPVRQKGGESPLKGDGKRIVVDGGFCEAYHRKTGIAGYTLVSTPNSLSIKAHQPFLSIEAALAANVDILSNTTVIERPERPLRVSDTDRGRRYAERVTELEALLAAYRSGDIAEHEGSWD